MSNASLLYIYIYIYVYMYDICHTVEPHQQVMIKANTPGCGKSYICEGMVELGYTLVSYALIIT